ncbi:MAG: Xylose isomerase domain protein barrel [Pedosphaera sp.]|nr:Xylose isomerase domain protein barrel [Pedosphaera sp.]
MLIGTMNHPARDLLAEIEWIAGLGLEFIDLTIEPPKAAVRQLDLPAIRAALKKYRLPVVGHTAYYLPIASPFESLRRAAVDELSRCLFAFAALGAQWMNLHPDHNVPMHDPAFVIERNLQSLRELSTVAHGCGVGLMIENLPGKFNTVAQLAPLLDPLPELGFHLDIGHANLLVEKNSTDELLSAFGSRLRHVHLHDNKGGNKDLHSPLGTGTLDLPHHIRSLQKSGYDGTITLEVFTSDWYYLAHSRDILRQLWSDTLSQH